MITGSPTLHMRLPSLCMQALGLGYSTVWANRAGSQSTRKLSLAIRTLSSGCDGFPSERDIVLTCLHNASTFGIIQGCALRTRRYSPASPTTSPRSTAQSTNVDTLFSVNCFFLCVLRSCCDRVEPGVIEGPVVAQHAVNGMEQFAHDSTQRLQRFLAFFDEMLEEGFDVGVMLFGRKGRHVQRLADLAVSRFGEPRGLMHALAGVKGSGIEAGVSDPLFVRETFRHCL